jgi:lysozyme
MFLLFNLSLIFLEALSCWCFSIPLDYDAVNIRTIGFGTACHAYDCSTITPPITRQQAETLMLKDIVANYAPCVTTNVRVTLNDNQFSALVAFVYNVGCGALRASTLLRRLNLGEYSAVPSELLKWNKAGGVVLAGLTRRRTVRHCFSLLFSLALFFSFHFVSSFFLSSEQSEGNLFALTTISPCVDGNTNVANPNYGNCTFNGAAGVCKDAGQCNGLATPGLCQGPSFIQCCTPIRPAVVVSYGTCSAGGQNGNCISQTSCTSKGGTTTAGLCPGRLSAPYRPSLPDISLLLQVILPSAAAPFPPLLITELVRLAEPLVCFAYLASPCPIFCLLFPFRPLYR